MPAALYVLYEDRRLSSNETYLIFRTLKPNNVMSFGCTYIEDALANGPYREFSSWKRTDGRKPKLWPLPGNNGFVKPNALEPAKQYLLLTKRTGSTYVTVTNRSLSRCIYFSGTIGNVRFSNFYISGNMSINFDVGVDINNSNVSLNTLFGLPGNLGQCQ